MGKLRKISDAEFLAVLRENAGLYARTARAIQTQWGIDYSRQAVRDRAEKHQDILQDIQEQNIDVAEQGLHSLMQSDNEPVKLKACEFYLKTRGRIRGYGERQEVMTSKNPADITTMAQEIVDRLVKQGFEEGEARGMLAKLHPEMVERVQ